jgi:Tfp pilus assembly protein PilV
MLSLICTKKGMGLIEVFIAIFLTAVGVMSLLSLQTTGWQTMARADYLGRASGILYKTLENYETIILNPCQPVTLGAQPEAQISMSGNSTAISGDLIYTVNTNIVNDVDIDGNLNVKAFVVTVTVTWPGNVTGIAESLAVTGQEFYKFPAGCIAVR